MRIPPIVAVLTFALGVSAHAQATEIPVPFDSAGRVTNMTPALAERLRLTSPTWPVQAEYRDARLFAVQPAGGFVLAVQRQTGAIDRYSLTDAQRATLRNAIDAAMTMTGRPTGEPGSQVISEPAGAAFARRQTLLAALVYGPLAASLADGGPGAGAAYLIVTGGTFFASYSAAQSQNFTRAQNHLGGHLGLASAGAVTLLGYAATDNADKGVRAAALGGAVVGTFAGIGLGRTLSDAEAHSATAGIESSALLTFAGSRLVGFSDHGTATAVAAGLVAGYPIGLMYPRRASYTVTAGDVDAVGSSGLIGGVLGAALLGKNPNEKVAAGVVGATYLAGLLVGDQFIARNYDLTQSEANLAGVAALAGGLVGVAVPVLASSDEPSFLFGAAGIGAAIGMAAVVGRAPHNGSAAPRVGAAPGKDARFRVDFGGAGALLGALSRTPGRYSLVHIGF